LTFGANDGASYLALNGAAGATTAATGNGTGNVDVYSGSTLTLGANMNLTGYLNVQDSGSTVNAQGHASAAVTLFVGHYGTTSVNVTNLGQVTFNTLYVGNGTAGSNLTLHGGDVINSLINLQNGSVLTVQEVNGIGLTLNGTSLSSLTIDPSSMDLIFTLNSQPNWDFRWADPNGGNWVSTIDSMISSGQITINSPDGYSVVDQGGYTYIMSGISTIPEPSSLVLACLAAAEVGVGITRRRRRMDQEVPVWENPTHSTCLPNPSATRALRGLLSRTRGREAGRTTIHSDHRSARVTRNCRKRRLLPRRGARFRSSPRASRRRYADSHRGQRRRRSAPPADAR